MVPSPNRSTKIKNAYFEEYYVQSKKEGWWPFVRPRHRSLKDFVLAREEWLNSKIAKVHSREREFYEDLLEDLEKFKKDVMREKRGKQRVEQKRSRQNVGRPRIGDGIVGNTSLNRSLKRQAINRIVTEDYLDVLEKAYKDIYSKDPRCLYIGIIEADEQVPRPPYTLRKPARSEKERLKRKRENTRLSGQRIRLKKKITKENLEKKISILEHELGPRTIYIIKECLHMSAEID